MEYRRERGLLDMHEEMGIMLQEVVGRRVGGYFLPACSGVAFSNNEFRWSARISRSDGLIRLVPGLGTRAVDRVSDYPVLIAPGQPQLRANVTVDEVLKYSPNRVDVINLEKNAFATIDVPEFLRAARGQDLPLALMLSRVQQDRLVRPMGRDFRGDDLVFTFEGLARETPFVAQLRELLDLLQQSLGTPVDVEFAWDAGEIYLLQCRPQGYGKDALPAAIPRDVAEANIIFSARRHVCNGRVPQATHIVYVDAEMYANLPDEKSLRDVGRAVGKLNQLLPKRKFVLIGPGRWGSRGDVRLGVPVTYSDINNAAMLVEVARARGYYLPDPSFGTHFFQDLVEASIRYLPVFLGQPGGKLNEAFLRNAENVLAEVLPEFAALAGTLRVIDVARQTGGLVLRVEMNAELDEALAYLAPPAAAGDTRGAEIVARPEPAEQHWRWRLRMAERIAAGLDGEKFGVKALYLIGSSRTGNAGAASDIDLVVHFAGTERQRHELLLWMEGWSRCLAEVNFLRTGCRLEGLLDLRFISDDDIARHTTFAAKINAATDPARQLPLHTAAAAGPDPHAKRA
jgi:pyruvate,water dikinase